MQMNKLWTYYLVATPLIAGQQQLLELAKLCVQWQLTLEWSKNVDSAGLLTGMINNSPPHPRFAQG